MKDHKDILVEAAHKDGMTVPQGYFADFAANMAEKLEPTPFEKGDAELLLRHRTLWQRVRPYVYMAAMFAGVWCMLKMFTLMSRTDHSLDVSPILAEALQDESFVNDYVINNIDQWDIMDQMINDGFDIDLLDEPIDEYYDNEQ